MTHKNSIKNLNFSGKITRFFLFNPALSLLVLVGIIAIGIGGYFSTPKQYNPEVTLPAFSVQTQYFGATAQEVEDFLTREMEEKMAEIPGVEKISSQSLDGGMSIVRVEFFVGEDLEESKVKVFSKVYENIDSINSNNISEPIVKNITPDDVAVGVFALSSHTLSQNEIRERAVEISYALQGIEGVANVNITGGQEKSLNITVDPERLRENNMSIIDVRNAVQANNGRSLLGDIKNGTEKTQIEVNAGILNAEEAKKIILSSGLRLGDIAEVEDGYRESSSHVSFINGEKTDENSQTVFISLAKRKGVNVDSVISAAKEKMDTILLSEVGENISATLVRDNAKIANDAVFGLGINLIQSIAIVSIILFLFLGTRSAFLVAMAIPLTLLFVFFAGFIGDQSINRITLFALILSLGLLVDSATVVVENIYRHLNENEKNLDRNEKTEHAHIQKKNIIVQSVNEVGIGLFLSTLTSVIVFLPMTQISGMMGPYMGPLSFFVPMALILSLFIAYSITPYLAFFVLHPKKVNTQNIPEKNIEKNKKTPEKLLKKIIQWLKKFSFENILENIQEKYATSIRYILERKKLQKTILISAFGSLFLCFSLIIFEAVHFQMLPKADNKTFWVTLDLPEGTDEEKTNTISHTLALFLQKQDTAHDIENIQIFSGTTPVVDFNGLFREFSQRNNSHQSSLLISLVDERTHSSEKNAEKTRKNIDLFKQHHNFSGEFLTSRVVEDPPGPPVQATVVAKIKGENPQAQQQVAKTIMNIFAQTDGVVDIDSSQEESYKKEVFQIYSEKAKEKKVSNKDIYDALSLAISPQNIGEFHPVKRNGKPSEVSYVELRTEKNKRDETKDLQDVFIRNGDGILIPLSSVMSKVSSESIPSLYRDEQQNVQYVTAEMQNRSVIYAIKDVIFALFKNTPENNLSVEKFSLYALTVQEKNTGELVTIEWGGEFEMTLDNFSDLGIAMIIAFILVYAILVGQFRSFAIPLLIMATVPLAMIGILPGFAYLDFTENIPLTATALIGFIALLGIVVNNAIIYLEYLEQLRKSNVGLLDAVVHAGKMRLRPIFLTSLTTVLGSLTIAADPVWSGLAWSIVFGLSLSTLLTLGIFPLLYFRNQIKKQN
jgi:multidrug efflux pump subunit AcrB